MSDLVKRLREVSSVLFDDYGDGTYAVEDYALATKAADRIKQLETALRIIVRETTAISPDVLNQQMCIDAVNRHAIAALEGRHD